MPDEIKTQNDTAIPQWKLPVAPFVLSVIASIIIYLSAHDSLGLFIAGPVVVAILIPGLTADVRSRIDCLLIVGVVLIPILLAWLMPVFHAVISLAHWVPCAMVITSFALGAMGISRLLARFCDATIASTLATLTLLAWLTWPIWLSPQLTSAAGERAVGWLTPAHPLFAINAAVAPRLGIWSEQPVAYTLTNLGQDVQYVLPRHVNWATLLHLAFALLVATPVCETSISAASGISSRTPRPLP